MTEWSARRLAIAVLSYACDPGDQRLSRLVAAHGPEATVAGLRRGGDDSVWSRRTRAVDEHSLAQRATEHGLRLVTPDDPEWPWQLADFERGVQVGGMGGVPLGLWVGGTPRLDEWLGDGVAIVGARAATRYGEAVATEMAARLSSEAPTYTVVSGGAYGIDAAAHRGALAAGGRSIGVYAGGLDEPYPRGNARIFEQLQADHLVISEVAPGVRVQRSSFLARNRLIAALTLGAVVVEAAARSGARNTATWASELGRIVMAVPGSVHSAASVGCHRLIRDAQATLVTDSDDVAALLAPVGSGPQLSVRGAQRPLDDLAPELLAVREAMPGRGVISAGELAGRCGQPVPEIVGQLIELEQLALVSRDENGQWRLKRPAQ